MKNKILAIPGTDFLSVYSGTLYLLKELNCNFDLSVMIKTVPQNADAYRETGLKCTCWTFWSPRWNVWMRSLSHIAFRAYIICKMMRASCILITEAGYLREAAWVKKIRIKKPLLIQFCQELCTLHDYPQSKFAAIYEKYATAPDYIIDVEPFRAEERMRYFHLSAKPFILINTVPGKNIPSPMSPGSLAKLAGVALPKHLPIVLFIGGIGKEKPFERIVDLVAATGSPCFLLAFCAAPEYLVANAKQYAAKKLHANHFFIANAKKRIDLLACIGEADVGIVDYTYSIEPTLNQKYCAPTKLYEYMACGLAVLGSNNDSLRAIIEENNLGYCAKDDTVEGLSQALSQILRDNAEMQTMKKNAAKCFIEKFSYEKNCLPEIKKIEHAIDAFYNS